MQVQMVHNQQNFTGTVFAHSLSRQQQKIKPVIQDYIKNKNYDIHVIDTTLPYSDSIAGAYGMAPKYVIFSTAFHGRYTEIEGAKTVTAGLAPKIWLKNIKGVMVEHENSCYLGEKVKADIKEFMKGIIL